MEFVYGEAVGGPFVMGVIDEWSWHRRGGSYAKNRDFFDIHWEAQEAQPVEIRLHVEAPCAAVDHELNMLKTNIVASLLSPDIQSIVTACGFKYKRGARVTNKCVAGFKTTEPFRVILDSHGASDIEENLRAVHEALGSLVGQRLEPFLADICRAFSS